MAIPRRLLLVDANGAHAATLLRYFGADPAPWELVVATTPAEAAELARSLEFVAALVALPVAGGSAKEALRRLEASSPELLCMLLVGDTPEASLAAEATAGPHLRMEFSGQSLRRAVDYAVERREGAARLLTEKGLSNALNRVHDIIDTTFDAPTMLRHVVGEAARALKVEGAFVALDEGGEFQIRHAAGVAETFLGQVECKTAFTTLLKAEKPRQVLAYHDAPHQADVNLKVWGSAGAKAVAIAPMVLRNQVIGAMVMISTSDPAPFGDLEREFLGNLSATLTLALDNADAYRTLTETRAALEASASRFQRIFDYLPDPVVIYDRDLNPQYMNVAASPALTTGDDFWKGAICRLCASAIQGTFADAKLRELEERAVSPTGIEKILYVRLVPVLAENGRVDEVVVVAQDVTERRRSEAMIAESEERFRTLAENIPQLAWMSDPQGNIFWFNRRWYEYTGTDPAEMVKGGWRHIVHPDHLPHVLASFGEALKTGEPWESTFPMLGAGGEYRWFLTRAFPIFDRRGAVSRWFGTNTDITERLNAEDSLRRANAILEAINSNTSALIFARDKDGRYVLANPALLGSLGHPAEEVIGHTAADWLDKGAARAARQSDLQVMQTGETLTFEAPMAGVGKDRVFLVTKSPWRGADGAVHGVVVVASEITERKRMEEQIRHIAEHDALTGLPNRRMFSELAQMQLARARRYKNRLALLFIDLDRFKYINDTLGHEVGDKLLAGVAERLRRALRHSDTIARIGGDEFNVLLADVGKPDQVADVAHSLVNALKEPFDVAGHTLYITGSIGVSIYPDDGESLDLLGRHADVAMYHAKEQGRNRFELFNASFNSRSIERLRTEYELRRGLALDQLQVLYQPLVELETHAVVGAEALVRWEHPERGLLPPHEFLPIAEENGLIFEIDNWVLRQVYRQVGEWIRAGRQPVPINVNLSARQFQSWDLEERMASLEREFGIQQGRINVEVTESVAMTNIEGVIHRMEALTSHGICIAIDDFGTGYSSLSYLKRMPVSKLKIDRSFVQDIATDPDDRAIIAAVTSMAHSMQLKVVAEGVESDEQAVFLRETHCDEGQGFLFHRPLPADQASAWIATGRGTPDA